jgi:hypothetical protein
MEVASSDDVFAGMRLFRFFSNTLFRKMCTQLRSEAILKGWLLLIESFEVGI